MSDARAQGPLQAYTRYFVRYLLSLRGMRLWAACFLAGSVTAAGFAPLGFFPVFWLGYPVLVLLLAHARGYRAAFVIGWLFSFGQMVFGLYWIAATMFVDIRAFWWGVPLAVAGLPALFAFYYGFAALIAVGLLRRFSLGASQAGCVIVALCWFAAEVARGTCFTGFPWNLSGHVWAHVLPVLQVTSVIGIYGLSLLTVLAACLPAALYVAKSAGRGAGIMIALFACLAIGGVVRLNQAPQASPVVGSATPTRIRILQPNTDQAHKWAQNSRESNFAQMIDDSTKPGDKPVDIIVWPETASTFYLMEDVEHRREITSRLMPGSVLLTGLIRRAEDDAGFLHYYNSMVALQPSGRVAAVYDKAHLVPFGEYIPLRHYIALRTLAALGVDFGAGPGPRSLHIDALPSFSPLICYEAIFPHEVTDPSDRPAFLVNITNDGWYGRTAGPYQHFANVRLRAIEEGLPLVRSANTGISGAVDAYGRILGQLALGQSGIIDIDLPPPLVPTFYAQHGALGVVLIYIISVLGVVVAIWRRRMPG